MSKIARSARVGSRQRTETITADKTIIRAESGELYLVGAADSSAGTAAGTTATDGVIRITLPTPEDGTYFKFLLTENSTGEVSITGSSTNYFTGRVAVQLGSTQAAAVDIGLGLAVDSPMTDNSEYVLKIPKSAGSGSVVEFHSNGTVWYVDGLLTGSTAVFA